MNDIPFGKFYDTQTNKEFISAFEEVKRNDDAEDTHYLLRNTLENCILLLWAMEMEVQTGTRFMLGLGNNFRREIMNCKKYSQRDQTGMRTIRFFASYLKSRCYY